MSKAYPKYKPSGEEWLGYVPEHWAVKRLKFQVTINDETLSETIDPDYEMLYVDISSVDPALGIIKKEELIFENAPSRARRIVKDGDTIVSTVRTYLRAIAPVANPEENLIVSTGFAVIRPRKIDKNYLSAAIRAPYFIEEVVSRSVGVSYPAINASELGSIAIPLPPLPEQQAIAAFLDRETGRIDALIAKKERLLELLAEQRAALISRTVTKGLDASVKLKPSGVEWLGDVPEHWEVKKVRRFLLEHKQGYYSTESYTDEGFKLLRISDFDGNGYVNSEDSPFVEKKADAYPFLLRENDFVFARTGGAGSFGLIKSLPEKTVFASYLIRFRFQKETIADFLRYSFSSRHFVHGILRNIHGGVNQNVHAEDIKEQIIPLPPTPEQQAIAAFLDRETGKIDALSAKVTTVIERLKEYRTALISSAVTGKIDVREAI